MVRISVPVNTYGMEFRMTIGTRLKSERERLGLTLPDFAELAGAKKNTVIDWQRDASSPPAAKLAALADAGVDPLYVLTGQRSIARPGMTDTEIEQFNDVVDTFWALSDPGRVMALNMLTALLAKETQEGSSRGLRKPKT